MEPTIKCPNCTTEIKLNESLAGPLIEKTRIEFEAKMKQQANEIQKRENEIHLRQQEVQSALKAIDEKVAEKLDVERKVIAKTEEQKARKAVSADIAAKAEELCELNEVLKARDQKLKEAQTAQVLFMKKERALKDKEREMDLSIEKQVQQSQASIRVKAQQEAEEKLNLKVAEKDQKLQQMAKQIEELQKKAEQGSQQTQGEVLELQLEETLRSKFPFDNIEPVPKGVSGADVIQRVISPSTSVCGAIIWETKRTKSWSNGWVAKLKTDQRAANAELAILLSTTLPNEITTFDQVDGIWVASPKYAVPLALALRQTLLEVANSKQSQEGQETKQALVYEYLTGPRFRHRVEAIVEKFTDMQDDLNKEKKAMTRMWAKREGQISAVIDSTVGMYGDLQGIAGQAIQEIEGMDLQMLEI